MNVNVSGTVLSSLFFEHGNSGCDVDGFLLGKITQHFTDTISDAHIKRTKEQTNCYIYSYVACRKPLTWYDGAGSLKISQLKKIIGDARLKDVIGWYKFRRNSSMRPTLREQHIHHNLTEAFPSVLVQNFIFFLCAPMQSTNKSTHDMEHVFLKNMGKEFVGLPVTVVNLGDTVNSEYRTQGSSTVSAEPGILHKTLEQLRPTFEAPDGHVHSVTGIQTLSLSLHERLKDLCDTVAASEDELRGLRESVRTLKARLKPKPKPDADVTKQVTVVPSQHAATGAKHLSSSINTSGLSSGNPFSPEVMRSSYTTNNHGVFSLTPDYPQDKYPLFTSSNAASAPSSEMNLISLDDDLALDRPNNAMNTRDSRSTSHHSVDSLLDFPETLSAPTIPHPVLIPQLSEESDNAANSQRETTANSTATEPFDFVRNVMKSTKIQHNNKATQEAIELSSSDEEQVIEYSTMPSSSPMY